MEFKGKYVLITGASQGIGNACAVRFAEDGATVFINYSNNDKAAQKTLDAVKAAKGDGSIIKADLGIPADVEAMWNAVTQVCTVPDVLVLNAAYQKKATIDETDLDLMRRTFDVNVLGNFQLAKLYIDACKAQKKKGNIVIHSSNQGEFVNPTGFAYSLTKAALNQMVKHLALFCVGANIRVNGVVLGWFDTDGERKFYSQEQIAEQAVKGIPMKRAGFPSEAADMAYFLASDASSYMTGSLLRLDGGFALAPDLST
jgi:glucose 1-dehydrogenase